MTYWHLNLIACYSVKNISDLKGRFDEPFAHQLGCMLNPLDAGIDFRYQIFDHSTEIAVDSQHMYLNEAERAN